MSTRQTANYYDHYWSHEELVAGGNEVGAAVQGILDRLVIPGTACLEVGCGPGETVGVWAKSRGSRYVGVDVSQVAVDRARALGLEARTIEDATMLPFKSGSFDVVLCLEVLEHLADPELAAREMQRVLRDGGSLVITVPNVSFWRRRLEVVVGRWNPMGDQYSVARPWRDPHIRFFNPGSLRRLLEEVGFESVEVGGHRGAFLGEIPYVGRSFHERPTSRWYQALERRFPGLLGLRVDVEARKSTSRR